MDNIEEKLPRYKYTNNRPAGNPYTPFIYALILSFGVLLGFIVNSITAGKQTILNRHYDKIEDVLNYISIKYVDSVNREQLVNRSIDKILSNLDPHSVYIPAKEVGEVNEELEGNFEGIGIEFSIVQDTIIVVSAIPGGPSEIVGLKSGDRIVKIDDTIVSGIKIKDTDVKHKLRGPKGTKVKVSVMRSGARDLIDFEIVRDKIPLISVDAAYEMNDNIGYIRISKFSATTHEEFVQKVHELEDKGMKKLIIDLRGNPGGYLQAATTIADELVGGEKLLVYTKGRAYDRQDYYSGKPGIFENGPLCLLIDRGSASASEILSGAIQDLDRGTIIGRTSFGKGLVQEQYDLRDGSVLRLTVARYYTPSGRCIQRPYDKGVEEYYNDNIGRFHETMEDTLNPGKDTAVYRTAKGRRVYGGGGIRPDIFVPEDTSYDNAYAISVFSFVPEFVYKYSSQHSDLTDKYKTEESFKNSFNVPAEMMKQFYEYAKAEGLKEDAAGDKKIESKLTLFLKAWVAKQAWRMDGYYYIMNDNDKVISVAVKKLESEN